MSEELRFIKKKLKEYIDEEFDCDEEEIKELEQILKEIENILEYCQVGDW